MILIHAWENGSFTTQAGGSGMSAWAEHQQAAKHGCVATYVSFVEVNGFNMSFCRYSESRLALTDDRFPTWQERIEVGVLGNAWKRWAAFCINKWGAWFTQVDGPTEEEVLTDRLKRLITTRYEASEGVLLNLVRPNPPAVVNNLLAKMVAMDILDVRESTNPRNHIVAKIYRLAV